MDPFGPSSVWVRPAFSPAPEIGSPEPVLGILFVCLLAVSTVTDLVSGRIPDRVTLPALALFLVLRGFFHPSLPYSMYLAGAAAGFLLFFLMAVLTRGGVGGGDIKLYAAVGMFLGLPAFLLGVCLSSLFGLIHGAVLLVSGRAKRNTRIPFAPHIAAGSLTAWLGGDEILRWVDGQL